MLVTLKVFKTSSSFGLFQRLYLYPTKTNNVNEGMFCNCLSILKSYKIIVVKEVFFVSWLLLVTNIKSLKNIAND